MPRPKKKRCCRRYPADRVLKPQGVPMRDLEPVTIDLDQFEAMRLCDHEDLDQTAAGERMGISRGTVQRLLYQGRKALVDAILRNQAILVTLNKEAK